MPSPALTAVVLLPCGHEADIRMDWPGGRSFHQQDKQRTCRVSHTGPRKFRLRVVARWKGRTHGYMAIDQVQDITAEPFTALTIMEAPWFDQYGGPYEAGSPDEEFAEQQVLCTKDADCPVEPKGNHYLECPIGQRAMDASIGNDFRPGWEAEVYVKNVQAAIEDLAQRYTRLGADLHRYATGVPTDLDTLGIDFAEMADDALQAIRSTQGNASLGRLLKYVIEAEKAQQENPAIFVTYRERNHP